MAFADLPPSVQADPEIGMILLYAGMAVNVAGVTYAIASAYIRGERRGDW